ncbi:E3 SUMO-protein ligase MMS21-like [Drosophila elegans]|uniref:E3 SUMO-protein ligase MMS21-like n=1 Tax=Drosophila elegans TaxID=30023 RepID=UPI0007E682E6|nr:E3 SUMO-protein ligase MMS21-like [Drosophila elegans]
MDFNHNVDLDTAKLPNEISDDDDVVMMELPVVKVFSPYDPWTKALLKNPVRNTICGHIYDRDVVHGLIKNNTGIRCPVAGCANRTYIHPPHLIEDAEIKKQMLQLIIQEAVMDSQELSSDNEDTNLEDITDEVKKDADGD